jgi:hypothetical protein
MSITPTVCQPAALTELATALGDEDVWGSEGIHSPAALSPLQNPLPVVLTALGTRGFVCSLCNPLAHGDEW